MEEFAVDLRRHLANEPIHATVPTRLDRAVKWAKRNPGKSSATVIVVVTFTVIALLLVAISRTNRELQARTAEAKASAIREGEKAAESERLSQEAIVREEAATVRADALWAMEELKTFHTLDDDLEYARSQYRPTYVWWLEKARDLVDGHPADRARGLRKKPGLADHRHLLAEIRRSAVEPSEAELAADRASHPKAKELEAKRAELLWTARMLGLEPLPSEAALEEGLSSDAESLNNMAWKLVDPEARVGGQEIRALALAQQAVAKAQGEARAAYRDTLAWALLWTGKFDEAVAEERRAIDEVAPEKRLEYEGYLHRIELQALPFRDGTARAQLEAMAGEVSTLEEAVNERRSFRFEDREKEWWNAHLGQLEQDLVEVEQRIALAERSVTGPEAARAWKAAIDAIAASPAYDGLRISPQLELLPLGPDPDSNLWEFAHLGTGESAVRGSDGKLALKPATGIVFVLLPSGRVPVEDGAQPTPLNEVVLDPFFLSKYEMTVAQWVRMSRWTGSFAGDELLLPANGVSWDDCIATLERAGLFLRLPTEAQWEYGCRAGTITRWWTGASEDTLQGAANIDFDPKDEKYGELEAIGQVRANPFGIHDVHGNVLEWCSDELEGESGAVRSGSHFRVFRGGTFGSDPAHARSGFRGGYDPGARGGAVGLRPARTIAP
jgi:formylglycine-generating enzyme required for sulfatase activity